MAPSHGPVPIFVEQRFPLKLSEEVDSLRALYDESKSARWDPIRGVDWESLDVASLAPEQRAAAARTWRRRAWVEATGLTETPAMVVRFCMEKGREAETRMFLTVRNTEEAWQVVACDRLARLFAPEGEAAPSRPETDAYSEVYNRGIHRDAFDSRIPLDALVAVHAWYEDGLEQALAERHLVQCRNPVVSAVLERFTEAKRRHARFGHAYLEHRAAGWSGDERAAIATALERHLHDVEFRGYHIPFLAGNVAGAEAEADRISAEAGLGAAAASDEAETLRDWTGFVRGELASLGVAMPEATHPAIGRI